MLKQTNLSQKQNRSITLQSPYMYMQIRVELFDLNENTAKHLHLHLDPCKVTQPTHELYATEDYSIQITDLNRWDAKGKTGDQKGI